MPHSLGAYLGLYIMVDLFNYTRCASSVAHIGASAWVAIILLIQSMTTTNTNDTEACCTTAEEIIGRWRRTGALHHSGSSSEAEKHENIKCHILPTAIRLRLLRCPLKS